jgi:hypothetical protein
VPSPWTFIRLAAIVGVGALVERLVTTGWRVTTGHTPPTDPEDIDSRTGEVVVYAVVSGALIALARVLAIRGAAHAYSRYSKRPLPES